MNDFQSVIYSLLDVINTVIPILFGFAIVFFIVALIKYGITGSDDQRKEAKGIIVYSLIAMAVCLSVWGLVRVLAGTFDFPLNLQINTKQESWSSVIKN